MKSAFIFLFFLISLSAKDYTSNQDVKVFINKLVKEHKIDKKNLERLFQNVTVQPKALRIYRPKKKKKRTAQQIARLKKLYPKYGAWDRYRRLKVNQSRVRQGVNFITKHQDIFDNVEKRFGVPKEYIAAIIGIETIYGANVGKFPVFDTLTTLAFEKNKRNKFFKKQLRKFIQLAHNQKFNPKNVYGSYAGAIGLGQFMPSNYEAYGVDYNNDGYIRLQEAGDAIASIANYFKKNRWRTGEQVATRVKYEGMRFNAYKTGYKKTYDRVELDGIEPREKWDYNGKVCLIKLNKNMYDELWYGAKNFFVLTRYNHSAYYAMSVHQLAQKIQAKMKE